jgi:3-oxoacyl-[acyl-carrier protein] reductase
MRETYAADALSGRKALVFAASQGLGKASAEKLAGMGAEVVIAARTESNLKQAARDINKANGTDVTIECLDVTDADALNAVLERHADTDILVSNCGGPLIAPFAELDIRVWDDAYHSIVRSVVIACQKLVPAMADRGWGRVVMMTSSVVVDPMRNFSVSNSLRKALLGLAESLAEEYGDKGVTANLVCPGLTRTQRMQSLVTDVAERTGADTESVINRMITPIATKRMAEPREIAAAVAYLCSEEAGFVLGTALLVDGGQSVNP